MAMYSAALLTVAWVKDPIASFCAWAWHDQKRGLTHYI